VRYRGEAEKIGGKLIVADFGQRLWRSVRPILGNLTQYRWWFQEVKI